MTNAKVDLLLCFPDIIPSRFVTDSLLHLTRAPNAERILARVGMRSEYARELLIHDFLKGESDYAFIVDVDMIIPYQAIERLLSRHKKMITGLCFSRGEITYPTIFEVEPLEVWPKTRYLEYPKDTLIEVGACGHGCLLIHRSVFEAMKPPYSRLGPYAGQELVGSDLRLCLKARKEAGIKIWCDTSVKTGHLTPLPITEHMWEENKRRNIVEYRRTD